MSRTDSEVLWFAWTQPAPDPEAEAKFLHVLEEAAHLRAKALGVALKPVGVERSLFGRVRPKALRQRDVQDAEVLVLVAGREWEADAGRACLAAYRHAAEAGTPVWFFACVIEDARLVAPDAAATSLLDLRDRIEQEGGAVIVEYDETGAWAEPLVQHIVLHLDGSKPEKAVPSFEMGDVAARLLPAGEKAGTLESVREAWSLAEAGRPTRARQLFVKTLAVTPEPFIRLEYARFLVQSSSPHRAKQLYQTVLAGAAAEAWSRAIADGYAMLGGACEEQGDLEEARRCFRKALRLHEQSGDTMQMATDYGSLGNVYWRLGELEKAEQAFREALALNKQAGHEEGMAADYGNLGSVYSVWGRLSEAEDMYRTSLDLNQRLGRRASMANQYGNLGILYRVEGRLDEAEDAYRLALAINEELGLREGLVEDYNNLGNVYQERGTLDEAEAMYRKALEQSEALGLSEGMANQYGNLGIVYQAQGRLAEAEQMFRRSLAIFETLGDVMTIEQVRSWISDLEVQRRG